MSEKKKIVLPSDEEVARYAAGEQPAPSEQTAPVGTPPTAPSANMETTDSLKAQLAECQDKLLRAQAECANIAKRLSQQQGEVVRWAPMPLARDLLHIVDGLERTLHNLEGAKPEDPVVRGVKLIADQLLKVLKDHGVRPIEAVGQHFNPALHEAIMGDRTSKLPPGTVVSELQRGYTLHDRVLRPSRVVVASTDEEAAEPAAPAECEKPDGELAGE
jgi:molecular chaperone GrpE